MPLPSSRLGVLALAVCYSMMLAGVGCRQKERANGENVLPILQTLNRNRGFLRAMAFSPQGKRLACSNCVLEGGVVKSIVIWDVESGKELKTIQIPWDSNALTFSPDGKLLASEEVSTTVILWETLTWKERTKFEGHEGSTSVLAFSSDGKMLASGGDKSIILWDMAKQAPRIVLKHRLFSLHTITISPDSKTILSAGQEGPIILWDCNTGEELWSFQSHEHPTSGVISVYSAAFAPDGKTVATGGIDSLVRIWEVSTKKELLTLHGHKDEVGGLAYSPDGQLLATVSGAVDKRPGEVRVWEPTTGRLLGVAKPAHGAKHVQFSPDGNNLAVGAGEGPHGDVEILDVSQLREKNPAR